VEKEGRQLGGFAHRVLLNRRAPAAKEDVEDVLAKAYLSAATRLLNDGIRVENMGVWFREVILRVCLNRARRGRFERSLFVSYNESEELILNFAVGAPLSIEEHIALREALDRLSEKERELVRLHVDGNSSPEIAQRIGGVANADSVRQQIKRTLTRLKKLLGGTT
jgi:RNA polymerase sigma factor (sigma-70 family)